MNESIIFNFTPSDILANATTLQIDSNPFLLIEILLFNILFILIIQLCLTLWFSRRHLK